MELHDIPPGLYYFECPICQGVNGGGILDEQHTIQDLKDDPDSQFNTPCVWCGQGPMEMVMVEYE